MKQVFARGTTMGTLTNIIEESKVINMTMAPRISPAIKTGLSMLTGVAMPVATKGLNIEPRSPEPIAENSS